MMRRWRSRLLGGCGVPAGRALCCCALGALRLGFCVVVFFLTRLSVALAFGLQEDLFPLLFLFCFQNARIKLSACSQFASDSQVL